MECDDRRVPSPVHPVERLGDAVGHEHAHVAIRQVERLLVERGLLQQPQRWAAFGQRLCPLVAAQDAVRMAGIGARQPPLRRRHPNDQRRHVRRAAPLVIQGRRHPGRDRRRPIGFSRHAAKRRAQQRQGHRRGDAFAGDVGNEHQADVGGGLEEVEEVAADAPGGHQHGRPLETARPPRHRRQQPALHPLGQRQLRLDHERRALAFGERQPRRAQVQPQIDGDAERHRQHAVTDPVQLELGWAQQPDEQRFDEAGHDETRHGDGGGPRQRPRRRGRAAGRVGNETAGAAAVAFIFRRCGR